MSERGASLAERTALVTGSAKRLGRATALALAAEGADVVIHWGSSEAEAAATAEAVRGLGRRAWTVQADLGDARAAAGLLRAATEAAGPVTILVNNASAYNENRLETVRADELARTVQVNALAPLALSRDFAAQGIEGDIVNFLDARVMDTDREHAAYHLSKRMLLALTRMTAVDFAPRVKVNAVAPGLVLPPEGQDEAYLERLAWTNPLGRHGTAEGVAAAVVFLVASDFITGQVIYVDGGRHLGAARREPRKE